MTWKAPMYRKAYSRKFGRRCFLLPKENKYPICSQGKIDCSGLRAAEYYVNMRPKHSTYRSLKRKIKTLKRKYCKSSK